MRMGLAACRNYPPCEPAWATRQAFGRFPSMETYFLTSKLSGKCDRYILAPRQNGRPDLIYISQGRNMHENTEIRREVKNISYHSGVCPRPRFIVIPAGIEFFHVTESATGRVKGFRRRHRDACELARSLEC